MRPIVWTRKLADVAQSLSRRPLDMADDRLANDCRTRAKEMVDHLRPGQTLQPWQNDIITQFRQRLHGVREWEGYYKAFEEAWGEAYKAAE